MTDYAAIARAVVPIEAECLDCDARFSDPLMRGKALTHAIDKQHFVCVTSRPFTDEEREKQEKES